MRVGATHTKIIEINRTVLTKLHEIRTGVPELRGPALVCLSAIDKKICLIISLQCIGLPHEPES